MKANGYAKSTINQAGRLLLSLAVLLGSAATTHSATRTWTGGYSSAYWSASANWDTGAPVVGDDLVFPVGAARLTNTNNLGNVTYRSITISGNDYVLRGTPGGATIGLTHGIDSSAADEFENTVELNIDLAADQSFSSDDPFGPLYMLGNVDIGNHTLEILGDGAIFFSGVISGSGGLTKNSSSFTHLIGSSDNSFSGATVVNSGVLKLSKPSGSAIKYGQLTIGDGVGINDTAIVRELYSHQIGNIPVTINEDGWLDVDDYIDAVGAITFNGGHAGTSGTGLLGLNGNVTVTASTEGSLLDGKVYMGSGIRIFDVDGGGAVSIVAILSGGGLTKTGTGSMGLQSANAYTGETTVEQGLLILLDDNGLGTTDGGTTINGAGYIQLVGVDVGIEPLTLDKPSSAPVLFAGDGCSWAGAVTLDEDATMQIVVGSMEFSGVIGGSGSLTKKGEGTLMLTGSGNSYTGDTTVNEGVLELAASNVIRHGALVIGDGADARESVVVRFLSDWPIHSDADVVIKADGLLDFNNYTDDLGYVLFDRGHLKTGTGELRVRGNIGAIESFSTNWSASILGNVDLGNTQRTFDIDTGTAFYLSAYTGGSGGITKTGDGLLVLSLSNSYAGVTSVNEGRVFVDDDHSLGGTGGGTTVGNGASLVLRYDNDIGNEALTLSGTGSSSTLGALASVSGSNTWAGPVTIAGVSRLTTYQSGDYLNLGGAIGGSGAVTMEGAGTVVYSGSTNTYTGDTYVNSGTLLLDKSIANSAILGDLYIGDGIGGADADVVRLVSGAEIGEVRITIASSGLFDMNNSSESFGSLDGSGHVNMGGGILTTGSDGSSTTYSGLIEGSGIFQKYGGGTFTLTGNNTYSGNTTVNSGTLLVNGFQPGSDVTVETSGTLGGVGTVGEIYSVGTVAPGTSAGQLGSGTATMDSGSTFEVELDGFAFTDYDRLNVEGKVALLNNPQLKLSLGYMPAVGDRFTIINNDDTDAVKGIFKGLPGGTTLSVGNATLRIDYDWGILLGNDVALTVTGVTPLEPLQITSIDTAGGDVELAWEGGVPFYVVEKKTNLTNGTWTAVFGPTRDLAASLPADTTNGFYRVNGGN